MVNLYWDGEQLYQRDGNLIIGQEGECCCVTTTGSTATTGTTATTSTSGSSGTIPSSGTSGTTGPTSGSSGSRSSGSSGIDECANNEDCCRCYYTLDKTDPDCPLESCPEGWIDLGDVCDFGGDLVGCDVPNPCTLTINDIGTIDCPDAQILGYILEPNQGVCCDGVCQEDCCDYYSEPIDRGAEGDCQDGEEYAGDGGTGGIFCCPAGCQAIGVYDTPGVWEGICCCQSSCECQCQCAGSADCGDQAACEAMGCVFSGEPSCGCDCSYFLEDVSFLVGNCEVPQEIQDDPSIVCQGSCWTGFWMLGCAPV